MARDKYLLETRGEAPDAEPVGTTVSEYAERFLKNIERRNRATTLRAYDQTLRLHILPAIGTVRIADLSTANVKAFYEGLTATVSGSMSAQIHATLRTLLNYAREERVIESSPLDSMKKAAPRYKRPRVESLTQKQANHVLEAVKSTRLEALFVLAITTGMRQGELFALRWSDIDDDFRFLSVVRSAQEIAGELTMVEPKTDRSRRRITLSQAAVRALKRRRKLAAKERHESPLVFPSVRGTPLRKSNFLRREWDPVRRAAGVPGARFHSLRHSCASLLLSEGVNPKIVSEMLGHSDIRLTLETYSHVLPGIQGTAAAAFDRILRPKRGSAGRQIGPESDR